MVRLRSRVSVRRIDEARLAVQTSGRRRILFGVIGIVLILAFMVGVDWEADFQPEVAAGNIFYFALTAVCLAVAGWNSAVLIDTGPRQVHFLKSIFRIPVHRRSLSTDTVTGVTLQVVRLLRESEQPAAGPMTSRFRSHMARRSVYYKLYLDGSERREFIEDSTDSTELEQAGTAMAQFLSVPFRKEEA